MRTNIRFLKHRPWMRIVLAISLITPLLGVLSFVGILLYARTEGGRERIRDYILHEGRKNLPGLEIGRVGGDYVHDLVLERLQVRDAEGRVAIGVKEIRARFSLRALLRKRLLVNELLVDSPQILGRVDRNGSLNLNNLVSPSESAPEPNGKQDGFGIAVVVERFRFLTGMADIEVPGRGSLLLSEININGAAHLKGPEFALDLQDLKLGAAVDGRRYGVDVKGRAWLNDGDLHGVLDRLIVKGLARGGDILLVGNVSGSVDSLGFSLKSTLPAQGAVEAQGRVGFVHGGLGDFALNAQFERIVPHLLEDRLPPGELNFSVVASGNRVPLAIGSQARLMFEMRPSRIGSLDIRTVHVSASSEGRMWNVHKGFADGAGLQIDIEGHGQNNGDAQRIEGLLKASVGSPRQGKLPAQFSAFSGRGSLSASVSGFIPGALDFKADVNGRKLGFAAMRIGQLALRAAGKASTNRTSASVDARGMLKDVQVGTTRIRRLDLVANAEGNLPIPRGRVHLTAGGLQLSRGAAELDRLALDIKNSGTFLTLRADAKGRDTLGSLSAHGNISAHESIITLDQFSFDTRNARINQNIFLEKPTQIVWRSADFLELGATHVRAKGSLFSGGVTTSGVYRLDLRGVREPRGTFALSLRKFSIPSVDPVDADVWIKLNRENLQAGIELGAGRGKLVAAAAIPLQKNAPFAVPKLATKGPISLNVTSHHVKIGDLPILQRALARRGLSGGTIDLAAAVSGDISQPEATLNFDLRDVELRKVSGKGRDSVVRRIPGVGASIRLETSSRAVKASGQANLFGIAFGTFSSQLEMSLGRLIAGDDPRRAPLALDVAIPKFNLGLLKEYEPKLRDTAGILSARISVRGSLRSPTGKGELSIAGASVDKLEFGPVEVRGESDGTVVNIAMSVQQKAGGDMNGKARLLWADRDELRGTFTARKLDLRFVRLFASGVREVGGVVDADIRASGTVRSPIFEGKAYYYGGRLGLTGQPTFQHLGLSLALTPGLLKLENFQAWSGGTLTGSGSVRLVGLNPIGMIVTARANRFQVAAAGSTGARIDGDFAMQVELQENIISGRVKIPQASVWLPKVGTSGRNLQKIGQREDIRFIDAAAESAAQSEQDNQHGKGLRRLDLRAVAGTVFVRGKDLDLELESDVQLTTNAQGEPAYNGGVRIRRGRVSMTGQRFDFERGIIAFDGAVQPHLDIRISHQYPEALVAVEVRGTPKKPELRLLSDPPTYDQAQIISLILTGEAGGQPSTGGNFDPTSAIASTIIGKLADKLAPELGLDVLRVETSQPQGPSGGLGATEARVEVGKYVSERIYLSYAHVFGANDAENANEAHVEYRASRRWLLETVFGDKGVGGVDALWSNRY